jgi:hypothetical protein
LSQAEWDRRAVEAFEARVRAAETSLNLQRMRQRGPRRAEGDWWLTNG